LLLAPIGLSAERRSKPPSGEPAEDADPKNRDHNAMRRNC
jgi:hypothetical protein